MPATLQGVGEQEALDNTMGAMTIGVIVSAVLFGISVPQTLYYYTRHNRDPLLLRLVVAVVVFLDLVHLVCISHTIYHYLVTNYYKHDALNNLVWSVLVESLPTGVTALFVQGFYAYRIYLLGNKNPIIPFIVVLLSLGTTASGAAWLVLSFKAQTFEKLLEISDLTMAINVLSMVNDVLIAACLCFLLARSRTGLEVTDRMISRLIVIVVNTGVLTSVCAVGSLVSLAVFPATLIYAAFYFCIGRLYTNSLLATLNARRRLKIRNDRELTMVSLSANWSGWAWGTHSSSTPPNFSMATRETTTGTESKIPEEHVASVPRSYGARFDSALS